MECGITKIHYLLRAEQSQYQKKNIMKKNPKCSIKFHTVQYNGCSQLLGNSNGKTPVFSSFDWSICNLSPLKCCFPFVPCEVRERELTLYFQFTHDTRHRGRPWIPYTISPSFLSSSSTPNTPLNHHGFGSNNKAKQVKF